MTRTKFFSLGMALALLLAFSLTGLDAAHARSHHSGGPDYTPEQQAEFKALWDGHHKQTEPLLRQLKGKRAELDVLYYSDNADSAKVQKIMRDMADIQAKLYMLDMDFRAKCESKGFPSHRGQRGGMGRGMGMMGGMGDCDLPRPQDGAGRLPNPYGPRGPMGYCQ